MRRINHPALFIPHFQAESLLNVLAGMSIRLRVRPRRDGALAAAHKVKIAAALMGANGRAFALTFIDVRRTDRMRTYLDGSAQLMDAGVFDVGADVAALGVGPIISVI